MLDGLINIKKSIDKNGFRTTLLFLFIYFYRELYFSYFFLLDI